MPKAIQGINTVEYTISSLLAVALIFICYSASPNEYHLNEEVLTIKKQFGKKEISIKEIESQAVLTNEEINFRIHFIASAGFFGHLGYYNSPQLGSLRMFSTSTKNMILLKLKSGTQIVISPDDAGFYGRLELMRMFV